jgi:hypothetical protein
LCQRRNDRGKAQSKGWSKGSTERTNWNRVFLKLQHRYPNVNAFSDRNFQHTPLRLIEEAAKAIDDDRMDFLEQIGQLTSLLSLSLQESKIDNVDSFLRSLNPYENQKLIERGLKVISPEAAAIVQKMAKLGNLPMYVKDYLDLETVKAIALWTH